MCVFVANHSRCHGHDNSWKAVKAGVVWRFVWKTKCRLTDGSVCLGVDFSACHGHAASWIPVEEGVILRCLFESKSRVTVGMVRSERRGGEFKGMGKRTVESSVPPWREEEMDVRGVVKYCDGERDSSWGKRDSWVRRG